MDETKLQMFLDRIEIGDIATRYARACDLQDWGLLRTCFADKVDADITGFTGKPPQTIQGEDLVALIRATLRGLKTHHLATNYTIEFEGPDTATFIFSWLAKHRQWTASDRGGDGFDMHSYFTTLVVRTTDGWRISKLKQKLTWADGDQRVMDMRLAATSSSLEEMAKAARETLA